MLHTHTYIYTHSPQFSTFSLPIFSRSHSSSSSSLLGPLSCMKCTLLSWWKMTLHLTHWTKSNVPSSILMQVKEAMPENKLTSLFFFLHNRVPVWLCQCNLHFNVFKAPSTWLDEVIKYLRERWRERYDLLLCCRREKYYLSRLLLLFLLSMPMHNINSLIGMHASCLFASSMMTLTPLLDATYLPRVVTCGFSFTLWRKISN